MAASPSESPSQPPRRPLTTERAPVDVPFTEALEAMRRDWLAGLPGRRAALLEAAEGLLAGERVAARALEQELHNLIASAGSHGVPELSQWGQEVREAIWRTDPEDAPALGELLLSSLPSFEGRTHAALQRPVQVTAFEAPLDRAATVLLIDDDPDMHRMVKVLLALADYETVAVRSGAEARATLDEVRPQLILLDTRLRSDDGHELFRQLRADGRLAFVPILFLSALSRASDVARGFRMGADDYIAKPLEPESFLARVVARMARARSLAEAAVRDPLTGLHNRRHSDEVLGAAVSASRRRREPLAVGLCDLDDFKRYNDSRGHLAGDSLLRHFARALESGVRLADTTSRWGGEEFLVVLPRCDAPGALSVMERIRRLFEAALQSAGLPRVTFSAGVALLDESDADGPALVKRADQALYRAKREGKNRVLVAGE